MNLLVVTNRSKYTIILYDQSIEFLMGHNKYFTKEIGSYIILIHLKTKYNYNCYNIEEVERVLFLNDRKLDSSERY